MSALSKIRRRRGVVRSSITRLEKRIKELEGIADQPATADHARELTSKLESLTEDFKQHHLELLDLIGDEDWEALEKEQDILDEHDDIVSDMNIRLKRLTRPRDSTPSPSHSNPTLRILSRKLNHLEKAITTIRDTITAIPPESDDISLLEQYSEQLTDHKATLSIIHEELLSVEDESSVEGELTIHSSLEDMLFTCFHNLRKLIKSLLDLPLVLVLTILDQVYDFPS